MSYLYNFVRSSLLTILVNQLVEQILIFQLYCNHTNIAHYLLLYY
nr:MAG TPA: hypothetical protein [Caudoviricetes sp.]